MDLTEAAKQIIFEQALKIALLEEELRQLRKEVADGDRVKGSDDPVSE